MNRQRLFKIRPARLGSSRRISYAVILLLLATVLLLIATSWQKHAAAAWMLVPYAAWVGFASLLNASLFALN